ncbi:hypothetical protein N0V93_002489 [Gnomoniopsis smithogilvyi]|uniref:Uncharacterized protein n=1 Tax=Gnomoniopsis smithogilvyi TaxID=1191159 RepID=A0A9W9CY84_9PEZI|nr:hypothetical protein N0V93_002489 [Gnomoniopsis smithogilvyi]
MSLALNASWAAPLQSQWNFTAASCVQYSAFLSFLLSGDIEKVDNFYRTVPVGTAMDFMRTMVPDDWTPQPSDKDLFLWYDAFASGNASWTDATQDSVFGITFEECGSTICPYLNWNGDADLSGIGMMITYYIAAIFSTIYYIVLTPELCAAYGRSLPWVSKTTRSRYGTCIAGFRESLQGTLDATLLFAISMLVAAVTRYVQIHLHPDKTYSLYGLMDSVFLSAFSIFPCFILQSLSHELRRRRVRLFMWLLVLIFAIVVDVEYNKYFLDVFSSEDKLEATLGTEQEFGQFVWLALCQSIPLMDSLETTLKVGHGLMVANCSWWVYYVVAGLGGRRWRPAIEAKAGKLWKWWESARLWLRVGNGLLCLAVMWTFLGLFTVYRADIAKKAAGTDNDSEWSFGQVLTLVTWIPIFVDLTVFYIYGAKEGHAGKMPSKYKVVDNTQEMIGGHVSYQPTFGDEKNAVRNDSLEQDRPDSSNFISRQDSWLED